MLKAGNKVFHIQVKVPGQPDSNQIQQVIVVNAGEDVNKAMTQAVEEITNRLNQDCVTRMAQGKPTEKEITIEITRITDPSCPESQSESPFLDHLSNFENAASNSKKPSEVYPERTEKENNSVRGGFGRVAPLQIHSALNTYRSMQAVRPRVLAPVESPRHPLPHQAVLSCGRPHRSFIPTGNSSIDELKRLAYSSDRSSAMAARLMSIPRSRPSQIGSPATRFVAYQPPPSQKRVQQPNVALTPNTFLLSNSAASTIANASTSLNANAPAQQNLDYSLNPVTMIIHPPQKSGSGTNTNTSGLIMRQYPNPLSESRPLQRFQQPLHKMQHNSFPRATNYDTSVLNRSRSMCLPPPRMSVGEVRASTRSLLVNHQPKLQMIPGRRHSLTSQSEDDLDGIECTSLIVFNYEFSPCFLFTCC